jgi:hypothetical protein
VGLFARTLLAQEITHELESAVLFKVPMYDYLKQAGSSMMGLGEVAEHPVVLVQLGDALRLGVQTDIVQSGLAVVFIPNSPNTFSASVFFVASDRVQRLDAPLAGALHSLERWGWEGVRSSATYPLMQLLRDAFAWPIAARPGARS